MKLETIVDGISERAVLQSLHNRRSTVIPFPFLLNSILHSLYFLMYQQENEVRRTHGWPSGVFQSAFIRRKSMSELTTHQVVIFYGPGLTDEIHSSVSNAIRKY